MRVEKAADLVYWTYFMVDWDKVNQKATDSKCSQCGQPLMLGESAIDSKGARYECYVCHRDKKVYWVRAG